MWRGTGKGLEGEKRAQGRLWLLRAGAQTGERCRWEVEWLQLKEKGMEKG